MTDEAKKARAEYAKKWRCKNRERINAYYRAWRKANPERVKETQARYWEKKARATDEDI